MADRITWARGAGTARRTPATSQPREPKSWSQLPTLRWRNGAHGVLATGLVLCLALAGALPSQAQELDWATRAGGTGFERGFGIAADNAGNSYVTGPFGGTAIFGAGEANETTLTPAGGLDIFVAKYDPSGALVWAKRAGGGGIDLGSAIATDGDANSYVTGRFSGTATFGAGDTNETILTGTNDIFVAKYDPSGALVWAKRAGGGTSGKEGLVHGCGRQQLHHRVVQRHGDVWRRRAQRDHAYGDGRRLRHLCRQVRPGRRPDLGQACGG